MIRIKAKIYLYKYNGRKKPFDSGYRPLFNFVEESKTSGMITLIHDHEFMPGTQKEVYIDFLNSEFLGSDFKTGKVFSFDEGSKILGEGEIIKIIDD